MKIFTEGDLLLGRGTSGGRQRRNELGERYWAEVTHDAKDAFETDAIE